LFIVATLLAIGVVMLASTSSVRAAASFRDPYFFLKRQVAWMAIGIGVGLVLRRFDYHWWKRLAVPLSVISVVSLVLVRIPHIGVKVGGSWRWLRAGPITVQPSELAKIVLVIFLAWWLTKRNCRVQKFRDGILIPLGAIGLVMGLLILEPDFGTLILCGMAGMAVVFVGGANWKHLVGLGLVGAVPLGLFVAHDPVRLTRILAFLWPEKYPEVAYHLQQSKVAFIRGELFGVGLGNSIQKQFYLPEAHTDFILAIVGEEKGLLATGIVVLLFIGLLVCGLIISSKAPDPFGRLLGFGLTTMLALQAAMNVAVVTGSMPTKGLPLPFISYGGSSMVASLAMVCILLNIARHGHPDNRDSHGRRIWDRVHDL
jgi:cell division protein FtsW